MERVRYVIVGMARSGTTATHAAIYGHPNICAMADEVRVSPFFTSGVASFTVGGINEYERKLNYGCLFDATTIYPSRAPDPQGKKLISYNGTPESPKADRQGIQANGLKVAIPNAEDAAALVDSLRKYFLEIKIIHVQRKDWVAQFASLHRATKTGVWHTQGNDAPPKPAETGKMTLPIQPFERYVDMAVEVENLLQSLGESHAVRKVSYEQEISVAGSPWARGVFEFLGVTPIDPTWQRLTKTAPPLEDYVDNVEPLREILAKRSPAHQ